MESSPGSVLSRNARRPRLLEFLAASCLLLVRIFALPATRIWRDWIAILCVFWMAAIFKTGSRAWPWICATIVCLLLTIYVSGQVPLLLLRLGIQGG